MNETNNVLTTIALSATIFGVIFFFVDKFEENTLKKEKLRLEIENKKLDLEILKQTKNENN